MDRRYQELTNCLICPHNCGVNRYETTGFCMASAGIKVNLSQLHFGEEPVLSGINGSGTIFFSHCNLKCVFCQNHTISHLGWGNNLSEEECVEMMLELQQKGAHNVNLVTPSHYSVQLATTLRMAKEAGLKIPVVWNSNAYEKTETLKRLDGLVDIYLPDMKYAGFEQSRLYSNAADYPMISRTAVKEMHRQVGSLICDAEGLAQKGLCIRLLVLPNDIAELSDTLHWIRDELGNNTYLSVMAQYYPAWQAINYPGISRGINRREYMEILDVLDELDFQNGFTQELSCSDEWTPDFKQTDDG